MDNNEIKTEILKCAMPDCDWFIEIKKGTPADILVAQGIYLEGLGPCCPSCQKSSKEAYD